MYINDGASLCFLQCDAMSSVIRMEMFTKEALSVTNLVNLPYLLARLLLGDIVLISRDVCLKYES